ncbi:hypothetical protein LWH94_19130 [Marinobacter sp. G11]|uniref:hypothetical protein n=1 Tax=Marinobacter sp. G11 TaxID=2903522 RepID=UPI001E4D9099|nr:hypothetical protein [Marinobacter sp. G11]MCE0761276.1 hypothetical protein [Marinobacter sp. G11]
MGISDEFGKFGAKLKNVNWSVSAENTDGELVVSLWKHFFEPPEDGKIRYVDSVTRWSGHGNKEFKERLAKAYDNQQVVRAVIARTSDENAVRRGEDASKLKNSFGAKLDWVGVVSHWDGDNFIIEFEREAHNA